jgi:hypothetical protein
VTCGAGSSCRRVFVLYHLVQVALLFTADFLLLIDPSTDLAFWRHACAAAAGGLQWAGCREFNKRAQLIQEAVKDFARQQQQQPLSAAALSRNFYCNWDQVRRVIHPPWLCSALTLQQRYWAMLLFQQVGTPPQPPTPPPHPSLYSSGWRFTAFCRPLTLRLFIVLRQSQSSAGVKQHKLALVHRAKLHLSTRNCERCMHKNYLMFLTIHSMPS